MKKTAVLALWLSMLVGTLMAATYAVLMVKDKGSPILAPVKCSARGR